MSVETTSVETTRAEAPAAPAAPPRPPAPPRPDWRHRPMGAMDRIASPNSMRILAAMLALIFLAVVAALILTPWRQNIDGWGQVTAFEPALRRQSVEAPVDGRIQRWHVMEGARVSAGDPLVDIVDNDPDVLQRLDQERTAVMGTISAAERKAAAMVEKIARIEATRESAIQAAERKIDMAVDKVRGAEQGLAAAEADAETAELNYTRQQGLAAKGLASTRTLELATLKRNETRAKVAKAKADLNAERNAQLAAEADLRKIDADYRSKIEDARGSLESARSDVEKARAELSKTQVKVARQSNLQVSAPADGVVFRVTARQGGEYVKAGDELIVLVPTAGETVVELWVKGNDAPLISAGRDVRLQFEGWPALQFAGWPSIAVGTFGGRVRMIDPADDGMGRFRVLVEPDPDDEPWPSATYLRQGARAHGWILLNDVSLGFELWRQFNGFPPVISPTEPGLGSSAPGKKEN